MKRPAGLIYWVDERPPASLLAILAVQHIFLMSSTLVLPVVLIGEIGGSFDQIRGVVAFTMIACGLGTIAQAMRFRGFGSGYLCPNLCGPNFFSASMSAAWLGGLPLMRGMTIAAGVFEALFARLVRRLRFLFPPEITGLVVLMVALSLIPLGTSKALGITYPDEPISVPGLALAAVTLMVMIAINVWSRGKLRLYGVLIGMVVGYVLSIATGLFGHEQLQELSRSPWLALPRIKGATDLAFSWNLLPAFLILSITRRTEVDGQSHDVREGERRGVEGARPRPHQRRASRRFRRRDAFRASRRDGVRHFREQRRPQQRVGRDQPEHRLRRRSALCRSRLLAENRGGPVGHADSGHGSDPGSRHLLHDLLRDADHPGVGGRSAEGLRDRSGLRVRGEPRRSSRPVRRRPGVAASAVRLITHAFNRDRRDPESRSCASAPPRARPWWPIRVVPKQL